jgi:hypothetical protein
MRLDLFFHLLLDEHGSHHGALPDIHVGDSLLPLFFLHDFLEDINKRGILVAQRLRIQQRAPHSVSGMPE